MARTPEPEKRLPQEGRRVIGKGSNTLRKILGLRNHRWRTKDGGRHAERSKKAKILSLDREEGKRLIKLNFTRIPNITRLWVVAMVPLMPKTNP